MADIEKMPSDERVGWVLTTPRSERPGRGPLPRLGIREITRLTMTPGMPDDLIGEAMSGFLTVDEAKEVHKETQAGQHEEVELRERERPAEVRPGEALLTAKGIIGDYISVYPSHIEWDTRLLKISKRVDTLPLRQIQKIEIRRQGLLRKNLHIVTTEGNDIELFDVDARNGKVVVDTIYRAMNGECPYIGEIRLGT